eukprot:scaffold98864_cov59-Phaeocystis_antarctica.AAC.6
MSKDDAPARKAAIVRAGAVEPLVAMLRGGSAGAQEQAAAALSRLADNTDYGVAIAQAGATEPLVALLKSGSKGVQEAAAAALCHLTESLTDADMQVAIVRAGAIKPLVALVRGRSAKAQEAAAFVLAGLALHNADNQAAIALAGAVEPLVTMIRLGSPPTRRAATLALLHLASMADTLVAFAQPGNLEALIAWTIGGTAEAQDRGDCAEAREVASDLLSRLAANSVEIKRAIEREGGVGGQRRLIGGSAGALHSLGSNILLTVVAGALLAFVVYSRRAARPRAKQVRRPEDRRRRRQAGAVAEATQDEAQVDTNKARAEVEAAKHKAAKAEATALTAAEKAVAAAKARAAAAAGKAARAAAAEKAAEAAKAAAAGKATSKAAAKAAAEKAAAERAAAEEAAKAAAAAAVAPDRPSSLPVVSLAAAQFDTGRRAVPESTIGGQTTCIVCFVNPKSHIAVPCGHQCACGDCAAKMNECPVCRNPAREWMQVRVA